MKKKRDAPVDRLLRHTLRARAAAAPEGACLAAETLAAWADDALDARGRATAEAHAADCARCQALLAAMVRTLPPAAATSAWRMPAFRWLVPLTVAAAAVVIWVAVPGPGPVQRSESAGPPAEQAASAPPVARPGPPADAQAKAEAAALPEGTLDRMRDAPSPPLEKKTASSTGANAVARTDTLTAAQAAPPVPSVASTAPAAPPADAAARDARAAPARQSAFANPLDSVIVSSNPATRFRLLPGGGVQRSSDGGATWRTEATGAADTLSAGSSPSPSVCWLIGRSGIVLLSTDGRSWRRLPFPETLDLRSVSATDNENATVTAADGRAFTTTDAGQTWSRVPGP